MTLLFALALAASLPSPVPAAVQAAVQAAAVPPASRARALEMSGSAPAGCEVDRAEVPGAVLASGKVAVHLFGRDESGRSCQGWAWVKVRASAPSLVTTREIAAGESLAGAVAPTEEEVLPGRRLLDRLPEGAVAERPLPAGSPVEESSVHVGPRPGEAVLVVLRTGALTVEQQGRATPCRRGRACALLPSGRRVEGDWHDGRIELGLP